MSMSRIGSIWSASTRLTSDHLGKWKSIFKHYQTHFRLHYLYWIDLIFFNFFTLLGYFSFTLQPLYDRHHIASFRLFLILIIPPCIWMVGLLYKKSKLLIFGVPVSWFLTFQMIHTCLLYTSPSPRD